VNDVAHHQIEELLAADALDGLDERGKRELELLLADHDPACPECARLRAEYADVASSMALSLDPSPVDAGAEERLIAAARAGPPRAEEPVAAAADETPVGPPVPLRPRWQPMRLLTVAIGAAACLLVAGVVGYSIRPSGTQQMLTAFEAQGDVHTAHLTSGSTSMTVYYRPGEQAALVSGSGFADPPAGHVYEVWYRPAGSSQMAPAGTFTPQSGSIVAPVVVDSGFTAVAVSVEPGYQTSPTGPVVLSGTVQPSG
jgi:Anti-sigma-K factor rskA